MDINIEQDATPWYAIKLFTLQLKNVRGYFETKELEYFIPMTYMDVEDKETHRLKHELRPVVHNLIFVKKTMEEKDMRKIVMESPYKMAVIKKSRESMEYYEIPARQMYEFQMMCNPDILMRKYLSEGEAKIKKGTPVMVHYGPLKGLTGKLVRSNKKYYLLKEVPGMGVMLKVSRWCCKPLE
ncbi:MAG: UpxY family transcription antiterminator [Prevotella sp.]|jgi:transcription antitermination factor NusG|nr:UpxY family transcription antiterminator [Prevotella sp.]MBR5061134.1 UpxY family transcription antiterminator [Prevotella sp.]